MAHATTPIRTCYLVRHAIAAPKGPDWPDDSLRPLTSKGARRMREVVRGLAALGVDIEQVMTSPLLRARQTADLLVEGLGGRGRRGAPVVTLQALAPGVGPAAVVQALAAATVASSVALVGHEPDLGQLAAWMLGLDRPLPFRKGGVCRIDIRHWPPRQDEELVWFAPPRILRQTG